MFKGKRLILYTGARYYTEEKVRIKDINAFASPEELANNYYVITNENPWGFGGFWIEPIGDGKLVLELYNIRNLKPRDTYPIEVFSPSRFRIEGEPEKYCTCSVVFSVNGFEMEEYKYRKTCNLISNIYSYNYSQKSKIKDCTSYYTYFYGNIRASQDLRKDWWQSKPNGNFAEETIKILREAGFPEKVLLANGVKVPLNNLESLNEFFARKQINKTQSAETTKLMNLFDFSEPAAIKKDKLLIQTNEKRIVFSCKGVKCFELQNGIYVPRRSRAIKFEAEKIPEIIETCVKFPLLQDFADFLRNNPSDLFHYDSSQWRPESTPFLEFLKEITEDGGIKRRYIENLSKLQPSCLLDNNPYGTRFYLEETLLKYVRLNEWDLPHQLSLTKYQLRRILELSQVPLVDLPLAGNIQRMLLELREILVLYFDTRENDYCPTITTEILQSKISDIPVPLFDWMIDMIKLNNSKESPIVFTRYRNPFRIRRKYFTNDTEFLRIIQKFWTTQYEFGENKYYWCAGHTNEYNDYLDMRQQLLEINALPEPKLFPLLPESVAQLSRLHDELAIMKDKQKMKLEQAKIDKYILDTQELADTLAFSDDNYSIKLCRDPLDLKVEGMKLHHCVGSYVDRILRQESYILFLRKKEQEDEPWLTVNLSADKHDILQIHGVNNWWMGNYPEVVPFVMRWLKRNKICCNDTILLSTAKGYCSGVAPLIPKPKI